MYVKEIENQLIILNGNINEKINKIMALISISGKISSGKDTVGKIIQIITNSPHFTDEAVVDFLGRNLYASKWKVKKFADKLKDIVCLLLDCSREQLEDREFKEKELGEEWTRYKVTYSNGITQTAYLGSEEEVEEFEKRSIIRSIKSVEKQRLTPRLLLQLIGTECGRDIIHPNIWINALMSEYKPLVSYQGGLLDLGMSNEQMEKIGEPVEAEYPKWIITDTRFPSEFWALDKKSALLLRVERDTELRYPDLWKEFQAQESIDSWDDFLTSKDMFNTVYHQSETALDEIAAQGLFVEVIENNGSLLQLVSKIRKILIDYKII